MFKRWIASATVAATLLTPMGWVNRAAAAQEHAPVIDNEITEAQRTAVERGLEALSKRQNKDGTFGADHAHAVAITSICAMAFMQAGNMPGRGKYGPQVEKALNYIVNATQESGLISSGSYSPPMYGHGFAAMFLAEAYGMTGDERVKEKLQKAIKLIMKSQNDQGGWRYQPAPVDADISVTICQVMALRAARDVGIKVEKEVIDKAIQYVTKCQNNDGGFSYVLGQGGAGGSGFARSGAGLSALFYAGISEGKQIDQGLQYLKKFPPGRGGNEGNYFYGHYYAVQAMYQAGGDAWNKWYPLIRDDLIKKQLKSGMWNGDNTEEYATGMALLIIQMPNRYLPVYSGKGPGS